MRKSSIDSGLLALKPKSTPVRHRLCQPSFLHASSKLCHHVKSTIPSIPTPKPISQQPPAYRSSPLIFHNDCAMASDEDYNSFLDQANQDTGTSNTSAQSTLAQLKATDTEIPTELQSVDQYYTSEADEPFEPVSLAWKGKSMPSESRLPIFQLLFSASFYRSISLQTSLHSASNRALTAIHR